MISFYRRQRGIHLITWQGVLALTFFPTVFAARFPIDQLQVEPVTLIFLLFAAQAAIGGLLLLADKTVLKNPSELKIWRLSLAAIFVAGFTFVFSVRFLIALITGVWPTKDNLIHLTTMSLGYVFWMLLISVAVANTEKFRSSFELLQTKVHEQKVVEFEQAIRLDAVKNEVASELISSLSVALDEDPRAENEELLQSKLIDMNENVLRPLGRALAQRPLSQTNLLSSRFYDPVQKTGALLALRRLGDIGPFDFKFAPILCVVLSFLAKSWLLAPNLAIASALVSYLVLTSLLFVANRIQKRIANSVTRGQFSLIVTMLFGVIVLVDMVVFRQLFGEHGLAKGLSLVAAETISLIVAALIRGTAIDRTRVLAELEAQSQNLNWAVARTGQLIWVEHQRLSKLLHGDVQAKVVAMANDLSKKTHRNSNNKERFDALIASCMEALSEPVQRQSLESFVGSLKELWAASLHIDLKIDEKVKTRLLDDSDAEASIEEIIRECITNAAKHGGAKTVNVEIEAPELIKGFVEIRITNDGQAIKSIANKGQGSKILDQVTLQWRRYSESGKTTTWALVPIK